MRSHKILKSYKTQYSDPIVLNKGNVVKLGKEEMNEKWKGWIWAENEINKGWIPIQIIKFSEDKKSGIILESYTAKELDVKKGDEIKKIRSMNGWTWAENLRTNDEGWIPDEIIEMLF